MSLGSEEKEAVIRVMDRGILSNYQGNWSDAFYGGPEIRALEQEWAEYFGAKHAIACNSATSGLWMACAAIGLTGKREKQYYSTASSTAIYTILEPDQVIVTPYSMTCSASIPLHFGAEPVFADIEPDYYCLDPASVEQAITPRTKAIIAVDLFGQPYDAAAINAIAERKGKKYGHKIYVIEDAAQAIGAKYKGKYAGTLGDIGVYSLNRHKHINCGEGGVVVTDDDELAMRLRLLMNHSEAVMNDVYLQKITFLKGDYIPLVGLNLRMTELSAAVAREQLKKLESILEKVREGAKYFPVKIRPECEHAFYRYVHDGKAMINGSIFNTKKHYIAPLFQLPLFKALGYDQDQCPVCREVEDNIYLAWLKAM